MESNGNGHQINHQGSREGVPPSAPSRGAVVNTEERREDHFPASEIMTLALEVTWTAADVYEIVAGVAESLAAPPVAGGTPGYQPLQLHLAHLRLIAKAIENTERQVRLLESKTVAGSPEIFGLFLEDCRMALATFKDVNGRLVEIIGPGSSGEPSLTSIEVLSQIMKRMGNCSEKVTGLPDAGLAASYLCLAETAFTLQNRAGELIGEAAGLS